MVEYITKSDAVFAACRVLTKFGGCSLGPFCPDSGCREVREVFESVPAADVVERPRWIPVTERLPEEDGKYLVRYVRDIDLEDGVHSDEVRIMRFANAQWRFPFICNSDVRKLVTMETVTHWMPLPELPKEGHP